MRALSAVELSVPAAQLMELRHEGRTYRWDVREHVQPISSSSDASADHEPVLPQARRVHRDQ
ncbi:hypothetical protein AQJ64_18315 [Streptomyces griseoruber]|uniref:Uncharacterized protein n=1 Tax=Streptomyces griseoruber TaxID=1943 RepID=A0A101SZ77_9ACTN|nr:hypothetical protein AQJ64_18315 [Streptomyces griseoruber]